MCIVVKRLLFVFKEFGVHASVLCEGLNVEVFYFSKSILEKTWSQKLQRALLCVLLQMGVCLEQNLLVAKLDSFAAPLALRSLTVSVSREALAQPLHRLLLVPDLLVPVNIKLLAFYLIMIL